MVMAFWPFGLGASLFILFHCGISRFADPASSPFFMKSALLDIYSLKIQVGQWVVCAVGNLRSFGFAAVTFFALLYKLDKISPPPAEPIIKTLLCDLYDYLTAGMNLDLSLAQI